MQSITASSLGCFRSCPRKYLYEYILCRRRVTEGAPLAIGRFAHTLLEEWWRGGAGAVLAALNSVARDIEPEDAAKVAAMLCKYNPKLPDGHCASERFKVLALEQKFDGTRIVNPDTGKPMASYCLAGKVDGLLEDTTDGSKWVLEHKTSSEEIMGYGPFWQRLSIDHQISYYMLATGAAGVLYDVLRKPGIRFCKKDSSMDAFQARCVADISGAPERYYQFRPITKTAADIAEAQADLWAQAHMLSDCARVNRWPRNSGACRSFFGLCEYLDVCTGCAQIDDDTLFRVKAGVNEELVMEAAK